MLLRDAFLIIGEQKPRGYRVKFHHLACEGGIKTEDFFPEEKEQMIATEEQAWELARQFAAKTVGKCVDVHVVTNTWMPVKGLIINNRNKE